MTRRQGDKATRRKRWRPGRARCDCDENERSSNFQVGALLASWDSAQEQYSGFYITGTVWSKKNGDGDW